MKKDKSSYTSKDVAKDFFDMVPVKLQKEACKPFLKEKPSAITNKALVDLIKRNFDMKYDAKMWHLAEYEPKVGDKVRVTTDEEELRYYSAECKDIAGQTGTIIAIEPRGLAPNICVNFDKKLTRHWIMEEVVWGNMGELFFPIDQPNPGQVVENSMYCSCGGPTKKVSAGIGPSSETYDFCLTCRKERR